MASAINSLPVPVSPLISTVALVGATTRTRLSTCRRAALLPIMRGSTSPRSSLWSSATFPDVASSISNDTIWLTSGPSLAQFACAAIPHSFGSSAILSILIHQSCLTPQFRVVASNYPELLHSEVKRSPLDSQSRRGSVDTSDDPSGMLEGLANVMSLNFFHCGELRRFNFSRLLHSFERRT